MTSDLIITGAREHNLKDISLRLPRDRFIVITGLSGSGKSSLAFDTIYAEGQRRYVESLSAYARQFLGQMDKPDVDCIEGLSPAISIDQKTTSRNPRSTVGTVTEIYDYLRLLYARVGHPHCPNCGRPIAGQSMQQIVDQVCELEPGTRFSVVAPVVRGRKGEYGKLFEQLRADGFTRVKVDGEVRELEEDIDLDKKFKHDIAVVVDRLVMKEGLRRRLTDSVETAAAARRRPRRRRDSPTATRTLTFSEKFACVALRHLAARDRSRASSASTARTAPARPATAWASRRRSTRTWSCPTARSASTRARCCRTASSRSAGSSRCSRASPSTFGVDTDVPWDDAARGAARPLPLRHRQGAHPAQLPQLPGPHAPLQRRASPASSSTCSGASPRPSRSRCARRSRSTWPTGRARSARGHGSSPRASPSPSASATSTSSRCMSVREALALPRTACTLSDTERLIGGRVIKEIGERLRFLNDVGVGYLTLQRASATLSRRRGAAHPPGHADRLGAGRRALHPRRAQHRPAPARQPPPHRHAAAPARPRQHGHRRRARRGDHALGRPHRRHGARAPASTAARWSPQGTPQRGHGRRRRRSPASSSPGAGASQLPGQRRLPLAVVHRARRAHAQPHDIDVALPARRLHLRHRRLRLGQVHARQRDPLQGHGGAPQPRHQAARRRPRRHRRRRAPRQGHRHRPVAHRPHAALQPGHLHRRVRPHPPAVRADPREQAARLQARALQLQRQGRPLRGLQGRRPDQDRDALPARRVRALRGLPAASATTARRSRCATRARTSPRCSR